MGKINGKTKFVLAVDWLELYGGAERVISSLSEVIDFEKVYTLIDERQKSKKNLFFKKEPVIHTTLLRYFKKYFKMFLPLFPYFFENIKIDKNADVIISSSFNIAKGINKSSEHQIHISIIQNENFRYINGKENLKIFFGYKRFFIKPFINYLKKWDIKSSKKPDIIISNSKFTQTQVREKYNRGSFIIYPPVDINQFKLCKTKANYFVAIGRLVQTKKFESIIQAFNKMPQENLIIIGDGILRDKLENMASSNIQFTGFLESAKVSELLQGAKASISLGIESFGIAAVESQACGTPVIALNFGGTAETVINGVTGVHVSDSTAKNLIHAVHQINNTTFDYSIIRKNAEQYSKEVFKDNFKQFLKSI